MILCNGQPKSMTHMLFKAIRLFDENSMIAIHEHRPFGSEFSEFTHHIQVVRNLRNVLISWCRYAKKLNITEEYIISQIEVTIKRANDFYPLISNENCLTVRAELLLTDPDELQKISDYIDMPLIENHFNRIWGQTETFTAKHSNWTEWWTPAIEEEWQAQDGPLIEHKMNYNPHLKYTRFKNVG